MPTTKTGSLRWHKTTSTSLCFLIRQLGRQALSKSSRMDSFAYPHLRSILKRCTQLQQRWIVAAFSYMSCSARIRAVLQSSQRSWILIVCLRTGAPGRLVRSLAVVVQRHKIAPSWCSKREMDSTAFSNAAPAPYSNAACTTRARVMSTSVQCTAKLALGVHRVRVTQQRDSARRGAR